MSFIAKLAAAAFLVALAVLGVAPGVHAQSAWPAKHVTIIVTYPAGGGADIMARLVAPKMAEVLGQSVVIENKGGAAGQIGAAFVAKSAPDGYTVMVDAASYAINPGLHANLPYDATKGFTPIGIIALFPHVVVVHPGFEAKTLADLIAAAKAKPGSISFASTGAGAAQHLAGAVFLQKTGLDMLHVPYKGGAPALNDVMGGHVPVFFANVASGLAYVKSGKLRALAISGAKRVDAIPDVPTLAESGVTGAEMYEWNAMFAPAGTPAPVVAKLADALGKALEQPDVRERIRALGGQSFTGGPTEAARFVDEQTKQMAAVIKAGNIKPE